MLGLQCQRLGGEGYKSQELGVRVMEVRDLG
jgi:hypothetical protein